MKGLILLFLVIAFAMIGWRYMDKQSKRGIKAVISQNIAAIVFAALAVAVAIVVSTNSTLRLV